MVKKGVGEAELNIFQNKYHITSHCASCLQDEFVLTEVRIHREEMQTETYIAEAMQGGLHDWPDSGGLKMIQFCSCLVGGHPLSSQHAREGVIARTLWEA
jgi:hypothetical protein